MEASYQELKNKQVINTVDGKNLGHVCDIVFDVVTACALGFVVPEPSPGFWGLFKGNKNIFIPFECVCKIGVDVILVELYVEDKPRNPHPPKKGGKGGGVIPLNNNMGENNPNYWRN